MPLTSLAVNALGVVTICLVALLIVTGLFCIIYILYFRARVQSSSFVRLGYFNGPWLVRITFIAFGICWGAGEVVRLSLFRQQGRFSHFLSRKWQEDMCKLYILSNLGFTEPCLFLTMSFLLRSSLKWRRSGIQHHKRNIKTVGYVLLYCLPIFFLDFLVVVAPKLHHGKTKLLHKLPKTFTSTYSLLTVSGQSVVVCTYPMLCTILHGIFATVVTAYLLMLGRQVVLSVINKGLQKRVYVLILMVSCFLPLRVVLIGFSVLARHERFLYEALAFSGFLALLSCVVVGIIVLVYLPVADSLSLNREGPSPRLRGTEAPSGTPCTSLEGHTDSLSLIAATNPSQVGTSTGTSVGRNSDASTKRGSISFRTMINDEATSAGVYEVEMGTFSPGFRPLITSSPGSPVELLPPR